MRILFERMIKDERGATAIEYALIAGFLSIAIVVAVTNLGTTLNTTFTNVATGLK
jgi:pilus assembly protein Flp/PilA